MKLGATIIDKHSNRKVGSYINYEFRNKDSNAALWMEGVIYKGHRIHDETWDKIKSGEYPALSIGADPLESKKECDAKTCWNAIKAIDLFEISVVDAPANPEATIEEVNSHGNRCTFRRDQEGCSRVVFRSCEAVVQGKL